MNNSFNVGDGLQRDVPRYGQEGRADANGDRNPVNPGRGAPLKHDNHYCRRECDSLGRIRLECERRRSDYEACVSDPASTRTPTSPDGPGKNDQNR